jgi:hypothetical protein
VDLVYKAEKYRQMEMGVFVGTTSGAKESLVAIEVCSLYISPLESKNRHLPNSQSILD